MKKLLRSWPLYLVLGLVAVLLAADLLSGGPGPKKITLTQFEQAIATHHVRSAILTDPDTASGQLVNADGSITKFTTKYPERYADVLTTELKNANVSTEERPKHTNVWLSVLLNVLPFVLLIAGFMFVINMMQGGGNRVMQFGKARARTVGKDQPKVTFADVAGADEAVAELQEIKEFLESPAKFQAIGAKIPKGVLLFGPPGTGKTLLARAVAGEAGVPFFSISGSDFVEMFVGVGASRVRDLFEQAKTNAPAIIFMDEIDAVGRHRGAGLGGGHDEREQTLNQLLVEMDGFDPRAGVILIAATNRPDILDPALLRPGRFDRQIVVDQPDLTGRRAILEVHAKGKPLAESVDLDVLARRTPGFTGADLANLMNEAALLTARHNAKRIGMAEMEESIDRVIAGPERKTRVMSDKEKLRIAYHESGHAIVGHVLPNADPIHKVSIVARGRALGLTYTLPVEEKYNNSRSELRDRIAMLLGGRSAEELIFEEPTTGAYDDIEKATQIARAMVTEYGMSEVLGPQQLGQKDGEVFLGRDFGHQRNYSDEVAARIDAEIRAIIDHGHQEARAILANHRDVLDRMATALVERETLDTPELDEILGPLPAWAGREAVSGIDAGDLDRLPAGSLTPSGSASPSPESEPGSESEEPARKPAAPRRRLPRPATGTA